MEIHGDPPSFSLHTFSKARCADPQNFLAGTRFALRQHGAARLFALRQCVNIRGDEFGAVARRFHVAKRVTARFVGADVKGANDVSARSEWHNDTAAQARRVDRPVNGANEMETLVLPCVVGDEMWHFPSEHGADGADLDR